MIEPFRISPRRRDTTRASAMQFIEMSGKTLLRIINQHEISPEDLNRMGVTEHSLVRVNRYGDIELRRTDRWDVIGGLLGDFNERLQRETGLDWA